MPIQDDKVLICDKCKLAKKNGQTANGNGNGSSLAIVLQKGNFCDEQKIDNEVSNKKTIELCELECKKESQIEKLARRIPCLGIIFSLIASLTLGSAGMLVKVTHSVHGVQISMFRFVNILIKFHITQD